MNKKQKALSYIGIIIILEITGCGRNQEIAKAETSQQKSETTYDIVVANPNSAVFRLNKNTGEILVITPDKRNLVLDGQSFVLETNNYHFISKPLTAEELLRGIPSQTNTTDTK
jgi:hypothetical protein